MVDIQWTFRARSLLFVVLLLFLVGYLFSSILSVFTGIGILTFLIYIRRSFQETLGTITVTRSVLEPLVYVNQPVHLMTRITSTGYDNYIKIADKFPDDVIVLSSEPSVFMRISFLRPLEITSNIQFQSRGAHEFKEMTIELYDPWQLFFIKHPSTTKTVFHIHSDPQDIHLAKRTKVSEDPKLLLPTLLGYDFRREYEGIRTYAPGDSSRDIDWKASSRLQTLASRLFQKQQAAETIIALDVSRSMRRRTGPTAQIEHGIAITIQLTHILQSLHHTVGFIAFDEHKIVSSVDPSVSYQEIFQTCSDLPSILLSETYIPVVPKYITRPSSIKPLEYQQFLSRISPFLTEGIRSAKNGVHVTGIYQTVTKILQHGQKNHIIIISDIGSNHNAFYSAISLAHAHQHTIWLLCMDAPQYTQNHDPIDKDQVEKIYEYQQARKILYKKLRSQHVEVIELSPKIQTNHILQTVQKKKG